MLGVIYQELLQPSADSNKYTLYWKKGFVCLFCVGDAACSFLTGQRRPTEKGLDPPKRFRGHSGYRWELLPVIGQGERLCTTRKAALYLRVLLRERNGDPWARGAALGHGYKMAAWNLDTMQHNQLAEARFQSYSEYSYFTYIFTEPQKVEHQLDFLGFFFVIYLLCLIALKKAIKI